ncbi:MAG: hypothetical protein AAGF81_06025 [Pseudomonadota bacterium]
MDARRLHIHVKIAIIPPAGLVVEIENPALIGIHTVAAHHKPGAVADRHNPAAVRPAHNGAGPAIADGLHIKVAGAPAKAAVVIVMNEHGRGRSPDGRSGQSGKNHPIVLASQNLGSAVETEVLAPGAPLTADLTLLPGALAFQSALPALTPFDPAVVILQLLAQLVSATLQAFGLRPVAPGFALEALAPAFLSPLDALFLTFQFSAFPGFKPVAATLALFTLLGALTYLLQAIVLLLLICGLLGFAFLTPALAVCGFLFALFLLGALAFFTPSLALVGLLAALLLGRAFLLLLALLGALALLAFALALLCLLTALLLGGPFLLFLALLGALALLALAFALFRLLTALLLGGPFLLLLTLLGALALLALALTLFCLLATLLLGRTLLLLFALLGALALLALAFALFRLLAALLLRCPFLLLLLLLGALPLFAFALALSSPAIALGSLAGAFFSLALRRCGLGHNKQAAICFLKGERRSRVLILRRQAQAKHNEKICGNPFEAINHHHESHYVIESLLNFDGNAIFGAIT